MTEQYYYAQGVHEFGPFSALQMRELAAAGRILPADLIWQSGTTRKVSAANVGNLFAGQTASAPAETMPAAESEPHEPASPAASEEIPADLAGAADPAPEEEATRLEPAAPEIPLTHSSRTASQQFHPRKKRVVSIKGAILMGQDGVEVKYRKKCRVCGHEDNCRSTAKIPQGTLRGTFYCPTCRRVQTVEIVGAG
jgi:Tfp pilus assembly protein FimV